MNQLKPPLKPPKPPKTITEVKSKVKQLIEFKSVFKSVELSSKDYRHRSTDTLPNTISLDEIKACEFMQQFFNTPNLIDQRSRVKATAQFKKHGPLNLRKLTTDGWLNFKKDIKDKGIM